MGPPTVARASQRPDSAAPAEFGRARYDWPDFGASDGRRKTNSLRPVYGLEGELVEESARSETADGRQAG